MSRLLVAVLIIHVAACRSASAVDAGGYDARPADAGTGRPSAEALAEVRRNATGAVIDGAQLVAVRNGLSAFEALLEPGEELADYKLTTFRRGGNWVVLFAPADPMISGGGIEYTFDSTGEHVVETIGGP